MSAAAPIRENLDRVRARIAAAAARSGRRPDDVRLVAVTKYADDAAVDVLLSAGQVDLGESRPQQFWRRAAQWPEARWHLIGPLQSNKVARTVAAAHLIHSVDSLALMKHIERAAVPLGRPAPVLLEVNISGDPAKHGFAPAEVPAALAAAAALHGLEVRGLMAMAGRPEDLPAAQDDFRRLRLLRDELRGSAPPPVRLDELSMGMSGDYEVAIAAGATLVRVGSALYEGAPP